jgi:NAD+ synthase
MKSEVRKLGAHMGLLDELVNAKPTDGLWHGGRGDEDQIGATYDELEEVMDLVEQNPNGFNFTSEELEKMPKRTFIALQIYKVL